MPSNQKKEKTTNKKVVSKTVASPSKKKSSTSKKGNLTANSKEQNKKKLKEDSKGTISKKKVTQSSAITKSAKDNRHGTTSKTSKKKVSSKKVAKFSTIQSVKEEKIKDKKTENKQDKNTKKVKTSNVKGLAQESTNRNFFKHVQNKLFKRSAVGEKKSLASSRYNTKKKHFISTPKQKTKKSTAIKTPFFTKNGKNLLLIVTILCVAIILCETVYCVYRKIDIDKHTIYYDSLNAVAIDDTDIVAVGSSNFKYSTYYDYTKGLEKAKLIKYDNNGNIIFEKMYDNGINTTFSSIVCVKDGYIVVGSGEFSEQEQEDGAREAIIIKYDKDGNIIWQKYYQVVTNTRFNKVIATSDGYIAIGQSIYANMEMGNHTTGGGIIVKYDFDGNEVWHNNHGGMKSGNFNDIVEVNGDFYVVGKDATDSANLVKFNKDGEYEWHKNYSYTDSIGFTGIAYFDNSLYVIGSKKILAEDINDDDNRDTTNTDALLIKYSLNGEMIFEKCFGGSNFERYNSILAYRDNLYVVGHTTSTDTGLKIDTDGELMTGILVRYDKDGNISKKEALGGSNNDNLTDIITDSVSLYISGYSNSKDGNITTAKNNGKDYFGKMIKLDFKFRTLMVK